LFAYEKFLGYDRLDETMIMIETADDVTIIFLGQIDSNCERGRPICCIYHIPQNISLGEKDWGESLTTNCTGLNFCDFPDLGYGQHSKCLS